MDSSNVPHLDLQDAGAVIEVLTSAAEAMLHSPLRRGACVNLPAKGRLLATGDLHDNPFHYQSIRTLARLERSPDHHVILHELIHGENLVNGMDFSFRMLARVAHLVLEHPGQVHPLLANHELSQLTNVGVSKGAGNSVELFREAIAFSFDEDADDVETAVHAFIRAMPLALRSEGGVLCAHSLPSAERMKIFDPGVLERPLEEEDYVRPHGQAYMMTWGRGYTDESAAALAEAWGVKLFCLGHAFVETGIEMAGPRIIVLNSDHARAAVLPLDLADLPTPEEAIMHAIPLASIAPA